MIICTIMYKDYEKMTLYQNCIVVMRIVNHINIGTIMRKGKQ